MTRLVNPALTMFGGDRRTAAPGGAGHQFCALPAAAATPLAWLESEPA